MIEYYAGTDGPTIVIENGDELITAIDILHTQTMDNVKDNDKPLKVLETAMRQLEALGFEIDY